MIIYHMRCPENGDTQRQAVEPGKPLRYLKLSCSEAMRILYRVSVSNPTPSYSMGSPTLGDPHRPLGLTPITPLPPPAGEEVELG